MPNAIRHKAEMLARLPSPPVRRALRQGAGVTLDDVADPCEVSRATVSRWERGLRNPTGRRLGLYLAVLDELREVAR